MTFLRARRTPATDTFWQEVRAAIVTAPAAVQELARGSESLVCSAAEARTALAWALAHPAWPAETVPIYIDGNDG